jgi:hypothetical protein
VCLALVVHERAMPMHDVPIFAAALQEGEQVACPSANAEVADHAGCVAQGAARKPTEFDTKSRGSLVFFCGSQGPVLALHGGLQPLAGRGRDGQHLEDFALDRVKFAGGGGLPLAVHRGLRELDALCDLQHAMRRLRDSWRSSSCTRSTRCSAMAKNQLSAWALISSGSRWNTGGILDAGQALVVRLA